LRVRRTAWFMPLSARLALCLPLLYAHSLLHMCLSATHAVDPTNNISAARYFPARRGALLRCSGGCAISAVSAFRISREFCLCAVPRRDARPRYSTQRAFARAYLDAAIVRSAWFVAFGLRRAALRKASFSPLSLASFHCARGILRRCMYSRAAALRARTCLRASRAAVATSSLFGLFSLRAS